MPARIWFTPRPCSAVPYRPRRRRPRPLPPRPPHRPATFPKRLRRPPLTKRPVHDETFADRFYRCSCSPSSSLLGGACARQHLSSHYAESYVAWFSAQHLPSRPVNESARRSIETLDAQEAELVSKNYRRNVGRGEDSGSQGRQIMMVAPRGAGEATCRRLRCRTDNEGRRLTASAPIVSPATYVNGTWFCIRTAIMTIVDRRAAIVDRRDHQRGATTVEFALVLPLLMASCSARLTAACWSSRATW